MSKLYDYFERRPRLVIVVYVALMILVGWAVSVGP
jgi:hypothetical protein